MLLIDQLMRLFPISTLLRTATCFLLGSIVTSALAQVMSKVPGSKEREALQEFLQHFDDDKTTRYSLAWIDLNEDGKSEALVHLVSNGWCGSGGCNTLVLAQDANSWRIVANITITRPPIRVLSARSNGWRDIGVWVRGGGVTTGYEAVLHFDGRTYPANPSAIPAPPVPEKAVGDVVIPANAQLLPMFPVKSPQAQPEYAGIQNPSSKEIRPSFDCSKAVTAIEKLVCSELELASMDNTMSSAYLEALKKLPPDDMARLRREHSEWFRKYSTTCNAVRSDKERKNCVFQYLSARTKSLQQE
ncbi:MAG TPA: lysozyme inhibitor LprI family protein [Bryobacteraceae bacterium]|nr:lysozyme inhibitor LprI family protein [Bryobacteraceae bacterium]